MAQDRTALSRLLAAAMKEGLSARGTTSPNPPVGAVIVSGDEIVGAGHTQPPGGAHAEVMALRAAGERARGATAVVTLEPCNHTGRTGPCAQALIDAQVAEVYYLHADPTAEAAGGAHHLREAGIVCEQLDAEVALSAGVADSLVPWLGSVQLGRPHVTLKFAQTLDGFTAAADGTSQWITGEQARAHVHADRAMRDAIIVGTGTALADNPSLSARRPNGSLYEHQPRRVVIGTRDLTDAADAASNLVAGGFEQFAEIDQALAALFAAGARDVLVEGGAGLASAFVKAGLVDAVQAYVAPLLLGEGRSVLAHPVGQTLADAARLTPVAATPLGPDMLLEFRRA